MLALVVLVLACDRRASAPPAPAPGLTVAADARPLVHTAECQRETARLRDQLGRATAMTGYAIDPRGYDPDAPDAGDGRLRGYPIRARYALDAAARAELTAALLTSVAGGDDASGAPACFDPHHAVHVELPDGALDLIICFECVQLEIVRPGEPDTFLLIDRSGEGVISRLIRPAVGTGAR